MAHGQSRKGGAGRTRLLAASTGQPLRAALAIGLTLALVLGLASGWPGAPALAGTEHQARICRSLIVVLNPKDARITIASSRAIGFEDGVTLTYDTEMPGDRHRFRRLTCAFANPKSSSPELIAVSSDGRSLGPVRLTFLKRFWLKSQDAARADGLMGEKR